MNSDRLRNIRTPDFNFGKDITRSSYLFFANKKDEIESEDVLHREFSEPENSTYLYSGYANGDIYPLFFASAAIAVAEKYRWNGWNMKSKHGCLQLGVRRIRPGHNLAVPNPFFFDLNSTSYRKGIDARRENHEIDLASIEG